MMDIFRQSLLEDVHGVVVICTQKVTEIVVERMKNESLREKLKSCLLSHLCTV